MNVFLHVFLHSKNAILKKGLFLLPFLFCALNSVAQISYRIEPGVLLDTGSENLGLMLNIESKVQFSEKTKLGLRIGIAINTQRYEVNDLSQFFIDDQHDNGIISFVPAFDYYFEEGIYRPYLGLGLGYYLFDNTDVTSRSAVREVLLGSVKNQLGVLFRGGLEVSRMRYGLEYNLIPKADIKIPDGQIIGTVDNRYFGFSVGFLIGNR